MKKSKYETLNKKQLVEFYAKETGLTKKDIMASLDLFLDMFQRAIKERKQLSLVGYFGTHIKDVAEVTRKDTIKGDGSTITIPAHTRVSVKVSKSLLK